METGVGEQQGASPGADTLLYSVLSLDAAAQGELRRGSVGEAVSLIPDRHSDDAFAVRVLSARNVDLGPLDTHRELVRRRLDRDQPVTAEFAEVTGDRATLRIDIDGRERTAIGRARDPVPYDTTRPRRESMKGRNGILLFGGLAAALLMALYFNMPGRTTPPLPADATAPAPAPTTAPAR